MISRTLPDHVGPRFFHMGGTVFDDHANAIPLDQAEALVGEWSRRALTAAQADEGAIARICARDALALHEVCEAARRRNRASGGLRDLARTA